MNMTYYRSASGAVLYASIQFFILTFLAMLLYPGGSVHFPQDSSYSFTHNYFSDLGSTMTFSGRGNLFSSVLFVYALVSIGIAMLYFARTPSFYASKGRKAGYTSKLATCVIVLSGWSFIAVAALPWNLYFSEHIIFVQSAFSFLLAYSAAVLILQVRYSWAKSYIAANFIYVLFLSAYTYILFYGPTYETLDGLRFQVISQKIIVYISILNFGYQALGIYKLTETTTT